ncbi:50S ribosomal protein L6 [Microgenomates group bacterium RBG_16_45_19]|nr:ribosomal protein L6 [uncultured bacterium]OGV95981.1 MAG: 50S ribosomal protein L6 [Microgenomates group bacterium RBG_16_45_19]
MSRLALNPLTIPLGVTVSLKEQTATVTGPLGTLTQAIPADIKLELTPTDLKVNQVATTYQAQANQGLIYRLLENMIIGVTTGFSRHLELVGTGYRAKPQGDQLEINAGYSHPVKFQPPPGIRLQVPTETTIEVHGIDKQLVGQVAANIRAIRPPEPYKGKGIRYQGEYVRHKAGKTTKVGAAA